MEERKREQRWGGTAASFMSRPVHNFFFFQPLRVPPPAAAHGHGGKGWRWWAGRHLAQTFGKGPGGGTARRQGTTSTRMYPSHTAATSRYLGRNPPKPTRGEGQREKKKIRIPPCAPRLAGIGTTTQLIGHYRAALNPKWLQDQGGESAGDSQRAGSRANQALSISDACRASSQHGQAWPGRRTGPSPRFPFFPQRRPDGLPCAWEGSHRGEGFGQFCPPGAFLCSMHGGTRWKSLGLLGV